MIVTIDVGNTNMVYGLYEGKKLLGGFRLSTNVRMTSDELGIMACQYFTRFGHDINKIEDVVVCSVVPSIMYSLTSAIVKYFGVTPLVIDMDIDPGLPYAGDERLGADRAVAIVSAIEKYGAPIIVLDFGTATTVDAVDANGTYLGGTISAGLKISSEALFSGTSALPRFELAKPAGVIGKNTNWQLQAGAFYSFIGGIEHTICCMKEELGGGDIKVVCTGGLSRLAAENCPSIDLADISLIPDGLILLYRRFKGLD